MKMTKPIRKQILFSILLLVLQKAAFAQTPRSYTSSEILLQIKKLNVLGSVLYIAAHPDDENTRLLAYLANEKLYRTGYLSLTRGDGGQNLIGDEQGVDLGLIRTQELLAARRVDGAEQFFSRAFDFGYSKSPEEALRTWGHDRILSDVVWVIRKFRPDVIITRFPTTGEGGHGHHTASAILAGEAFVAAADPSKFPEQLSAGVTVWQAKRLLWNTFNFGSTNTQSESQFKLDCGDYNPILGKSYGEIAATSRSQHKSQGFGVPAQRGSVIEYFKTITGDAPERGLMDGVNTGWDRLLFGGQLINRPNREDNTQNLVDSIFSNFSVEHPEKSVPALVRLYSKIESVKDLYWKEQKLKEVKQVIGECSGLFLDATTNTQFASPGDSLKITLLINNRLGANISGASASVDNGRVLFDPLKKNVNAIKTYTLMVKPAMKLTQPYWLEKPMEKGSFTVDDQQQIGKGESDPWSAEFNLTIEGLAVKYNRPIRYRYTDPVKAELYQPVSIIPVADVKLDKDVYIVSKHSPLTADLKITPNTSRNASYITVATMPLKKTAGIARKEFTIATIQKDKPTHFEVSIAPDELDKVPSTISAEIKATAPASMPSNSYSRIISYDHIPSIVYQKPAVAKTIYLDLKTEGNLVGYIPGAGDKIPEALVQMGYKVVTLRENDMNAGYLKQFDAIVTGVRAYNTLTWVINAYDVLMQYVNEGGVMLVQYNTNNNLGPMSSRIGPYPFTIGGKRITDEEAKVNFLLPDHAALNYPNKITDKDFEGWIQERSTYHAEHIDSSYRRILSMKDPGEQEDDGALIIAEYGKGRFVYAGLVFFRELPAGVPGAYRLFANLIANNRNKYIK